MSVIVRETGDIFDCGADAIVIPVNAVGVPGKGLALAAARKWPRWAAKYKGACRAGTLRAGGIHVAEGTGLVNGEWRDFTIVALATKDHWRYPSRLEWVREGLERLVAWAQQEQVGRLAVPALGSGLGGLPWGVVRPLMVSMLEGVDGKVVVFAPQETR